MNVNTPVPSNPIVAELEFWPVCKSAAQRKHRRHGCTHRSMLSYTLRSTPSRYCCVLRFSTLSGRGKCSLEPGLNSAWWSFSGSSSSSSTPVNTQKPSVVKHKHTACHAVGRCLTQAATNVNVYHILFSLQSWICSTVCPKPARGEPVRLRQQEPCPAVVL